MHSNKVDNDTNTNMVRATLAKESVRSCNITISAEKAQVVFRDRPKHIEVHCEDTTNINSVFGHALSNDAEPIKSPYGGVGDILWLKEPYVLQNTKNFVIGVREQIHMDIVAGEYNHIPVIKCVPGHVSVPIADDFYIIPSYRADVWPEESMLPIPNESEWRPAERMDMEHSRITLRIKEHTATDVKRAWAEAKRGTPMWSTLPPDTDPSMWIWSIQFEVLYQNITQVVNTGE